MVSPYLEEITGKLDGEEGGDFGLAGVVNVLLEQALGHGGVPLSALQADLPHVHHHQSRDILIQFRQDLRC